MERLSRNAFRTTFMLLMLVLGYHKQLLSNSLKVSKAAVRQREQLRYRSKCFTKGTNNGVVTDLDGNFTLTMQDDAPKVIIIFLIWV